MFEYWDISLRSTWKYPNVAQILLGAILLGRHSRSIPSDTFLS